MNKKNNILIAVQEKTSLSYKQVNDLYKITKSYDAILEVVEISNKYNIDVMRLAIFLHKGIENE